MFASVNLGGTLLTKADRKLIAEHGLDAKEVERQIELFKRGVTHAELLRPCVIDNGIVRIAPAEEPALIQAFSRAADAGRISKFVPASGAATRMFRDLMTVYKAYPNLSIGTLEERAHAKESAAVFALRFMRNLAKFAFYPELKQALKDDGYDLDELLQAGDARTILQYLLTDKGLGFSELPKGMVLFHRHTDRAHTPFEEQVLEGIELVSDAEGVVRIHFTVPPEHHESIDGALRNFIEEYVGEDFEVVLEYSVQKPSTDTIAVTPDNEPFRGNDENLLFRPGGHGALLDNLNDLDADIVLIKNIDNVVPRPAASDKLFRKKVLAGYLVQLQDQIHRYLKELESKTLKGEAIDEMRDFVHDHLHLSLPAGFDDWALDRKKEWMMNRLHRPLRVCGMVPNTGEPGGGPFWVRDAEGNESAQIIETSQINLEDSKQRGYLEAATHFNPVDLVCGLRDHKGRKYDLHAYSDPEAVFISNKSHEGKPLRALELPGLWNGAMAHWNTVFVEVPQHTFTPVKTVNDLLREEHRS